VTGKTSEVAVTDTGVKWLLGTYTGSFNRRHKLVGHLFSGRYKSLIVDGSGTGYLKSVCDYLHLNPARAKMVPVNARLKSFVWSSWPSYLLPRSKRPVWLRVDRLLGESGFQKDGAGERQSLEQSLEARRSAKECDDFIAIRRGWCVGAEAFRQELLEQMNERVGPEHFGEERAATAEAVAEQIIADELKRLRWREADLKVRRKGGLEKVALAARLRGETTLTVGWIVERLGMGTRGYLNHLLYRHRKADRDKPKSRTDP